MTSQTPNPHDETTYPLSSQGGDFTSSPPRSLEAIELLRCAWLYAADTDRDIWDYAVEASTLQQSGLTLTDCRWLAAKGYVQHASELTQPRAGSRTFQACSGLTFDDQACFVLTDAGLVFANSILNPSLSLCSIPAKAELPNPSSPQSRSARDSTAKLGPIRPHWDCDSRELRFNGEIVKQFKVPSPNQEIVIMSFEEEQWPTCIDDPLPYRADRDPKQRLHDTIRSLNRNQKNRMLRFKGNGTGQGIIWEPVTSEENGRE